ncbi:hypothetical protein OE766_01475 [Pararhizobium sp. YC-54]|uniref:hypothetical protein n=1 Tax=Pararhizobium sp. YC-54 TaxID=2986920 RepID=UPI0021F6E5C8|nr:hypothetical protein [Pararhizobium sp. YC-54]MCV9996915.1 hypothetical protein [Pararhizobium sp. YC-54]
MYGVQIWYMLDARALEHDAHGAKYADIESMGLRVKDTEIPSKLEILIVLE